ncbi:hypothetical protein QCA50_014356 [Cerrena zonata]|uniref:Uncharacterized protein n=1 Tax=Cerrena zonata TaxID=2478898 RepID=A0AAW0FNZ7_9APHY
MLSLILSCLVWATYVLSQDFAIPTSWREPTSNTSFVERALLAETVLNTISVDLNTGQNQYLFYNQNANLFSAVALLDLITHNSTNHALVSAAFRAVATAQPGFVTPIDMHYNVDPLTWGLAAIRAYHTYGDTYFLDTATTIWQNISSYQVSTANGANKIPVPKQSAIQSQCNGTTTAGAVFVIANNPTDLTSNAATTGAFMECVANV